MKYSIVSRLNIDSLAWDSLVDKSPDGWVFGLYKWQELILSVPEWKFVDHSFAVTAGNELVAVIPLQFNKATSELLSSAWGGAGPIVSSTCSLKKRKEILEFAFSYVDDLAKSNSAVAFRFSLSPVNKRSVDSLRGINPFLDFDFKDCSGVSKIIDLTVSEEELWGGLKPDARREIKKAQNNMVKVFDVSWAEYLDRYYDLHVKTYTRTGVNPHPRKYFEGIATGVGMDGFSILKCATSGEDIVGFHNTAIFSEAAYYHTGCSVDHSEVPGVSYLLMWEALLGAKRRGCKLYDVGAVFPAVRSGKQKGLTVFKSKFGGDLYRSYSLAKEYESPYMTAQPPGNVLTRILRKTRSYF